MKKSIASAQTEGLLVAAAIFACAGLSAAPAQAQSFDCRNVHYTDEAAICQDRALGRLDDQLTSVYNRMFDRLPPNEQRRLDRAEDAWVAERRSCGADPNCLADAYRNRMRQLEGATAAAPQPQAPPTLRPQAPPPGYPAPPAGYPVPPPPFPGFGGAPVAIERGFPPPPSYAPPPRQTGETVEQAPAVERRESTETVQRRDERSIQTEKEMKQSAEPAQQRRQVTTETETEAAPEARDTGTQSKSTISGRHSIETTTARPTRPDSGATATTEPPVETAAPFQPMTPSADTSSPSRARHHRTATVKPDQKTTAKAEQQVAKPAAPPIPPTPAAPEHATTTAAQSPRAPAAGSSTEPAASKPSVRWVDPPPSH